VYSSDGHKLGFVAGIAVNIDTGEQYLEVRTGPGHGLYVPKRAIEYAVLGRPVRLKVSADEANERYRERPNLF
jgi:hypothetical protein